MEKVKINIVPKGLKPACYVSQNDNGRVVRFELFDELTPYTLDGSETITITVVRPDGVELVSSVVNTEDSYIDVVFNDDMTAIAGIADCELTITDGETVLGSRNFDMNVEIDAYNGKDVVIETETGTLLSFNTEVEDNALEYESEIPYNAEGYTGLRVINSRTAPVFNKTPYLFRKTPDGSGNSCIEKLNGLTVAFNQVVGDPFNVTNGTISQSGNEITVSVTDTTQASRIDTNFYNNKDHVYLRRAYVKASQGAFNMTWYGALPKRINANNTWQEMSDVLKSSYDSQNWKLYIGVEDINTPSSYQVKDVNVIDLTQMFGSTIADYLYNLETQTSGAGVQKFKELGFDAPYYSYNAGALLSSKPVSKKVVGKNQFCNKPYSEWHKTTGYLILQNALKPDIPLIMSFRDKDPSVDISGCYLGFIKSGVVSAPSSQYYRWCLNNGTIRPNTTNTSVEGDNLLSDVFIYPNDETTYNKIFTRYDIQIEIGDTITSYEPYSEETYNLGGDDLRGLLKLDANNNIFAYGDIKTSDGNIKRKFDIDTLFNTLDCNWNYQSSYNYWFIDGSDYSKILGAIGNISDDIAANVLTIDYPIASLDWFNSNRENLPNKCIAFGSSGIVYLRDTSITSTSYNGAKSTANAINILYEKASETTESSTPFDNPQEVKVTEEFIDERSIPIPVGHDTIYGTDIEYQDIDFDTTIFGGDINAIDGVLTSRYNSDGSVKTTPDVIELDPALIPVKAGDNNIFNSASGAQTIRYYNQED